MDLGFINEEFTIINGKSVLEFGQASVWECFDFLENTKRDETYTITFLQDFINKYSIIGEGLEKVKLEEANIKELWIAIRDRHFKGFFSEVDQNTDKSEHAPFSSIIQLLGEKTGQDPYELMKKWSYIQFQTWLEGLTWNMREQSEEGKKENNIRRKEHRDVNFMKDKLNTLDNVFANYDEMIKDGRLKVVSESKVQTK